MKKNIFILGVGRNTPVYMDLAESCGYNPVALYHYNGDKVGESIHGVPVVDSNINLFKKSSLKGELFAVSVGNNLIRQDLSNKIRERGGLIPTLIHPSAIISKYAVLEEGVVVHANSVVQADAIIEVDSVVCYNVSVTHTTKVGKGCYLAFGSTIGAYVTIHDNVFIGQSAAIVSGKVDYIGCSATVGAGSVVINNVEPFTVVAGNPAKVIRTLNG